MKTFIEKLISSFKEVVSVYPWLKLAIASLVGVLGGSSFITFLNKYAIYNYSVSYGARLPAESVPYIDVSISILSFAFLTISLVSALLIYGLLTIIAEKLHQRFKNLPEMVVKIFSGIITSFIASGASALFSYLSKGGEFPSFDLINSGIIIISLGILLTSLIVWKRLIRPFSLLASLALISLVAYKLFDANNYASFLREIQYGGGVPVTLVSNKENEITNGYLFLTTKTTSVVWSPKNEEYIELPISSLKQIHFHEGQEYQLPEIEGSLISLFKHLW